MAVDGGYDKIAWSTGEQQFDRWGSQAFAWSKGKTGWRIIGKEQSGGEAFAGMEEALSQEAKESDTIVTSKEELRNVVEDVMGRERSDYSPENWKTHIGKMVDGMWERMQNEDSGTTMPRREGMKGFYDKILPTVAKKVSKRLGGDGVVSETRVGEARRDEQNDEAGMQQSISITPAMRAKVQQGLPLMQKGKSAATDEEWNAAIDAASEAVGLMSEEGAIEEGAKMIASDDGKREFRNAIKAAWATPKERRTSKTKQAAEKSSGVKKTRPKETVDVKAALKDQIRLEARAAREAKADVNAKRKDFAARIREMLKSDLYGKMKPRQSEAIITRAARTNPDSPRQVARFFDYASRVVADANYAEDLAAAKAAIKKARKLARNKSIPANLQQILSGIGALDPLYVEDLGELTMMAEQFMRSFESPSKDKYRMADAKAMRKYLSEVESAAEKRRVAALAEEADDLGFDAAKMQEAIMDGTLDEFASNLDEEQLSAMREHLLSLANGARSDLYAMDTSSMSNEEKAALRSLMEVDTSMMTDSQLGEYVFYVDNITTNESLDGIGQAVALASGLNRVKEVGAITAKGDVRTDWPVGKTSAIRDALRRAYSGSPNAMVRIAGFAHTLGDVSEAMGDAELRKGKSRTDSDVTKEGNALNDFLREQSRKAKKNGRDLDSMRGKLMEGMVGVAIQQVPRHDAQESFEINRSRILDDIERMEKALDENKGHRNLRKEYETLRSLYDEFLAEASSADDLKAAFRKAMPENAAVMDYLITMNAKYADELLSHNRRFRNQDDERMADYLPITTITSEFASKEQEANIGEKPVAKTAYDRFSERIPKPYQAGGLKQRSAARRMREGTRFDYNLRRNNIQSLAEKLYDARTSQTWLSIREALRSKDAAAALGGAANVRFMQEKMSDLYNAQVRKGIDAVTGFLSKETEKAIDDINDRLRRYAAFLGLAGGWQFVQQASDQAVNTLGMSAMKGKMGRRLPESMADVYLRDSNGLAFLLDLGSIGERAKLMAGTRWNTELESQMRRVENTIGTGAVKSLQDFHEKMADAMFVALRTSDVFNATTQWVQYYKDYLDSKGIKVDDWAQEARMVMEGDKERSRAFSYAENKTDLTQGPSDPTRFAPIGRKSRNVVINVLKTAGAPFMSFPTSQYARLMQSVSEAVAGVTTERRKEAFRVMGSTAASIASFHATRNFLRPVAMYYLALGIKGAIESMVGDDDEEKALSMLALLSELAFMSKVNDRDLNKAVQDAYAQSRKERVLGPEYDARMEMRQRLADNVKMWYTSMLTEITTGGLPSGVGEAQTEGLNRLGYLVGVLAEDPSVMKKSGEPMDYDRWARNPDNTPFAYYGQWNKQPEYGMYSLLYKKTSDLIGKRLDAVMESDEERAKEDYEKYIKPEFRSRYYDNLDTFKNFVLEARKDPERLPEIKKELAQWAKGIDPQRVGSYMEGLAKGMRQKDAEPWMLAIDSEPDPRARALAYYAHWSDASEQERAAMDRQAAKLGILRSKTAMYVNQLKKGSYRGSPEK